MTVEEAADDEGVTRRSAIKLALSLAMLNAAPWTASAWQYIDKEMDQPSLTSKAPVVDPQEAKFVPMLLVPSDIEVTGAHALYVRDQINSMQKQIQAQTGQLLRMDFLRPLTVKADMTAADFRRSNDSLGEALYETVQSGIAKLSPTTEHDTSPHKYLVFCMGNIRSETNPLLGQAHAALGKPHVGLILADPIHQECSPSAVAAHEALHLLGVGHVDSRLHPGDVMTAYRGAPDERIVISPGIYWNVPGKTPGVDVRRSLYATGPLAVEGQFKMAFRRRTTSLGEVRTGVMPIAAASSGRRRYVQEFEGGIIGGMEGRRAFIVSGEALTRWNFEEHGLPVSDPVVKGGKTVQQFEGDVITTAAPAFSLSLSPSPRGGPTFGR